MALTPEEEKSLREKIRLDLAARERRMQASHGDEESARQEQLELRMRQMIREEEEEKYFSERGYVKHKNRYGEMEWLPLEESEKRQARRRTSKKNKSKNKQRQTRKYMQWLVNLGIVAIAGMAFLFVMRYNPSQQASQTGSILVESDIAGATIYVNGIDKGVQTPFTLNGLSAGGNYYISVFKDGYSTWPPMLRLTPEKGQAVHAGFKLSQSAKMVVVPVHSDETDYQLFIDGLPTPVHNGQVQVPAGFRVVTAVKEGYLTVPAYQRLLISPEGNQQIDLSFQPSGDIGFLEIHSNYPDAYVYLDRRLTGHKAYLQKIPVATGLYEVRLRANGMICTPPVERLHIEAGKTTITNFSLQPATLSDTLQILSASPGATIFINGRPTPFVTPATAVIFSDGDHFVNLYRDNQLALAEDIYVNTGVLDKNVLTVDF